MIGKKTFVLGSWFGMELRELAGKSQDEAADWLGIDSTAVSRMESGKRRVTVAHLRSYLQLYGWAHRTPTTFFSCVESRRSAVGMSPQECVPANSTDRGHKERPRPCYLCHRADPVPRPWWWSDLTGIDRVLVNNNAEFGAARLKLIPGAGLPSGT